MTDRSVAAVGVILTAIFVCAVGTYDATAAEVHRARKPIPTSYVVVLKDDIIDEAEYILDDLAAGHKGKLKKELTPLLKAGHFELTDAQARAIAHDPRVKGVWEDSEMDLAASVTPRSWNLDRIDERLSPRLDNSYESCTTGKGVRAYIVDTGIWGAHSEFSNPDPVTGGTRVPLGYDRDTQFGGSNRSNDPPCNKSIYAPESHLYGGSHGTAVASVLGGKTLGVASDVVLVPVRVYTCEVGGGYVEALKGLNWIINEPVPAGTKRIVNMSWTVTVAVGSAKHPLEDAIDTLIGQGIVVVVAAGNDNTTTEAYVPARYASAIVVGGTKGRNPADPDSRWNDGPTDNPGSNYGTSIDLFAPADRVMVAQWTSPTATRDVNDPRWSSGTSFAAPLVAGVVARRLQLFLETNEQMITRLVNDATSDVHGLNLLDRRPGSPNRLLYTYTNCKTRVCCTQ